MFPTAQFPPPLPELRTSDMVRGDRIDIDGQRVTAEWAWQGSGPTGPERLWLPLDLLESRLGFRRGQVTPDQTLEWFGSVQKLATLPSQTLGDEVGLEVADWLRDVGVTMNRSRGLLVLGLPSARLQRLRQGKGSTADRLVFDVDGPLFVQRRGNDLLLDLRIDRSQRRLLQRLNLNPRQTDSGLELRGQASRLRSLSLAAPWRVVLDGVSTGSPAALSRRQETRPLPVANPAIASLIRRGFVLERRTVRVGAKPLELLRAGGDLRLLGLTLAPLAMKGRQQGLRFLPQLSQPAGALVAVNGGFFNRIKQLPLGALRRGGQWLSGPILNRGVVAWGDGGSPVFGRLRLDQELRVDGGRRWGLGFLNSGYVQRGLSRYTAAWGPHYRALSGGEQALLIRGGAVTEHYGSAQLNRGVRLPKGADLVVARGRAPLPAEPGERVTLMQRPNMPLGDLPNVLGGGPLLMQAGRVVLNGRGEGFSPGFLGLAAPRTVIGKGRGGTWMITVRGVAGSGPTLLETALAVQQLGLTDALNLDGGSSTTLVAAGSTLMTGRGSAPRIHNGLGLVPNRPLPLW